MMPQRVVAAGEDLARRDETMSLASCTIADLEQAESAAAVHLIEQIHLARPFHHYYELVRHRPYSFLLDSAAPGRGVGRYSFLGADPHTVLVVKRRPGQPPGAGGWVTILRRLGGVDGTGYVVAQRCLADPFEQIRTWLTRWSPPACERADSPVPFVGGAVGYLGYEMLYFIEQVPDRGRDDLGLPDGYLQFVDTVLAHDHAAGCSFLSVIGRGPNETAAQREARRRRDAWIRRIRAYERATGSLPSRAGQGPPSGARRTGSGGPTIRAHFSERRYAELVRRVKRRIEAGEVFEVCATHRLEADFAGDPWALYGHLRRINAAPFAAFVRFPQVCVVCSSPERFLRVWPDGWAESRPIKGTRPRAPDRARDDRLRRELLDSAKDRAENIMIVDLVRNDFGRVCRFGSVHVPQAMAVEDHATVFQMVSTIRGRLDARRDAIDLIRACFPGGSMTGAPKIQAMKIIDELEPVKRGIYSGSIGYLSYNGHVDLNIVIRTIVLKDHKAFIQVGGAIVADSDPRAEYAESMDKARALITALQACGSP